jgi:hypothetical protein
MTLVVHRPPIVRPIEDGHIMDEDDNVVWSGPVLGLEVDGQIVRMIPLKQTMHAHHYWTVVQALAGVGGHQ